MDVDYDQSNAPAPVADDVTQQSSAFTQAASDAQAAMRGGASMNGDSTSNANGGDATDMDMDIDIDIGPDPATEYLETEPVLTTIYPSEKQQAQVAAENVSSNEDTNPEKVHIRGVDELTTDDIETLANEHFTEEAPTKIEWIDDTSANIVYSSAEVGLRALIALSQEQSEANGQTEDLLRLRLAKSLSTHPDSVLQVRSAVATDKKRARAHEASRFYLLHPEHDPRERSRNAPRRRNHGRRYDQDEEDDGEGGYNRRRFDNREHKRRLDIASDQNLTESMYDDDVDMDEDIIRRGRESVRGKGRKELFPNDANGSHRLRGRSTSPIHSRRDDGSAGGFRTRSPRLRRFRNEDDERAKNRGKELFPTPKELFPAKSPPTTAYDSSTSFLKGNGSAVSRHRRSIAFDAADVTASLSRRMSTSESSASAANKTNKAVELFPQYTSTDTQRLKIKGAVNNKTTSDMGIQIKGAASASVRELFPSKFNPNQGKELFSDKIQGRGGRRRRAEDMFG
ncbi:hypothetical protein KEM54_002307 [Ascosphaera aggregata]|nr:hypothetical protein KEM54_002307 [Ascosphaera aggregata]